MMLVTICAAAVISPPITAGVAQDPATLNLFRDGVVVAELPAGDVIASTHSASLLKARKIGLVFYDPTDKPGVDTSGSSHLLVAKSDVRQAKITLEPYSKEGFIHISGAVSHSSPKYEHFPIRDVIDEGGRVKPAHVLFQRPLLSFLREKGSTDRLPLTACAYRKRMYLASATDKRRSAGYDFSFQCNDVKGATRYYHIQLLANQKLTFWSLTQIFM